ncbi:butyrate kinase [bacterium 3DAC]|jgi:butyrate kinase|nr:butyrate kinase [Dictyoglomota bacterium]UZN23183.1 butyrate kinase [bacterium 3DAC]
MDKDRIVVVNPGSTSTKLGLFRATDTGVEKIVVETIDHPQEELDKFQNVLEEKDMRKKAVLDFMAKHGVTKENLLAFAVRGGPVKAMEGGTYEVNEKIVDDILNWRVEAHHISLVGIVIGYELAKEFGVKAYFTDPVSVDEFEDYARLSGLPELPRRSHGHMLNLRAVVRKYASEVGKDIKDVNAVAVHLGGGFSIAAIKNGRIVDINNANEGGPFQVERAGSLPVGDLVRYIYDKKPDKVETLKRIAGKGGMYAHLGTKDFREALKMAETDEKAKLIIDAMLYQVSKEIAAMASVLKGNVEIIIVTGGLAYNDYVINFFKHYVGWIAPFKTYPGGFEMEALAEGAWRVIKGIEQPKVYQ